MTADIVTTVTEAEAQRLTARITLMAGTLREGFEKLHALVAEAKAGNVHVVLGYPSWTAYLADVLGKEPMRLAADERRELVAYLSGEGMSTRAIAPIVGVSVGQVHADRTAGVQSLNTSALAVDTTTGEITEAAPAPAPVVGLDGKSYPTPPQRRPVAPDDRQRRQPIHEQARNAGWELDKVIERLARIAADDRLPANRVEVATQLHNHLTRAIEVCQDLADRLADHT